MNSKHITFKIFSILVLVSVALAGMPTTSVQAEDVSETFSSSGSWTAPDGVTSIKVEVWGAGGAGGGDTSSSGEGGGGGGGGAYARIDSYTVVPETSYSFVVGEGGNGDTGNGDNGGASWFINASTLHANGGTGGQGGNGGAGGAGGAAGTTGDVHFKGGNGATSVRSDWGGGGGGSAGSASAGNNGNNGSGSNSSGGSAVADGGPGGDGDNSDGDPPDFGPGGGGGGAGETSSWDDDSGGNGWDGQIRITYDFPGSIITTTGAGTWIAPSGVTSIKVEVWGGGGGGGGDNEYYGGGAGGGGGSAYARIDTYSVTPGNSYNYFIGVGGSAGSTSGNGGNGGNGGNTWFNNVSTLNANGGSGGQGGNNGTGGGGGTAGTTGDAHFSGGNGRTSTSDGQGGGGGGSGGSASNGINSTGINGATAVTNGGPGGDGGSNDYGHSPTSGPGGGGGGGENSGTSGRTGGVGAPGQIIITYNLVINVPPEVTFDLQAGSDNGPNDSDNLTNAASPVFDAVFSEAVTGFTESDLSNEGTATGCTFSIGAPSGNTYPVTINTCSEGTLILRLAADAVSDGELGNIQTDGPTVTIDRTKPNVTIDLQSTSDSGDSNSDDLTNATSPVFDVDFDEPIFGFAPGDLNNTGTATGCTFNLGTATVNSHPVTVNTCSEGTLIVRLLANQVTDAYGNGVNQTDGPTVTLDRTGPTITDVTSSLANGTYGIAQLVPIQVIFHEDLSLTGSPKLTIDTGFPPTTVLDYVSTTGNDTLNFDYTTIAGNFSNDLSYVGTDSFDLNGGTIFDAAGNAGNVTLPAPGDPGSLSFNKDIKILTDIPPTGVDDYKTVIEDAPATLISVLGNDTDPDGGPIQIFSVDQPDHGTVVINPSKASLTYEPDPDYCNDGITTDDFPYTLAPGGSVATVFVTVTCVNDAPINTLPGSFLLNPGVQSALGGISVADPEWNAVTTQLSVTSGTLHVTLTGATIIAGANDSMDMTLSGTKAQVNAALASLKFTGTADTTLTMHSVDDAPSHDTDLADIEINLAPVLTVPGAQFINEGVQTSIPGLSVADVNGNLTSAQASVTAGSLNVTLSGAATITAGANDSGSLTVSGTQAEVNTALASLKFTGTVPTTLTILVTDSLALTDSDTVDITINHAPVNTVPGAMVITTGFPTAITGISVADADDNLITTQLSAPTGVFVVNLTGTGAVISAGSNTSNNLTLSGNVTQINAALATLTFNPSANTIITVLSTDEEAMTDSDTIAITANNPPTAVNDNYTVPESTDPESLNVMSNDPDPDGNGGNPDLTKKIASVTQPANGTVVIAGDELSLTYEPDTFYCNTSGGVPKDTFTYTLKPGNSTATVTMTVTCIPSPTITAITPNYGSIDGGTNLTITGTNFTGTDNEVTSVKFGSDEYTIVTTTATSGQCRRPTSPSSPITCVTKAHVAEIVDVEVTTRGGIATKVDGYQFVPYPILTSVSINIGTTFGGTSVLVAGQNFKSESGATITWTTSLVTFGGNVAVCTINSPTQMACMTPPHPAGTVDIAATNPGGIGTGDDLFTYVVPYFQGVAPNFGPTTGGTEVVIIGTGFRDATEVTFGGVVADCIPDIYFDKTVNADVISDTTIYCETPAHSAGMVDVVIWDEAVELHHFTQSFTYIPPITDVNPSYGPTAGGYQVTITGTDFTGATSVKFGGIEVSSYTVVNDNTVTAIVAPHSPGLVDVSVTSPGGGTMVSPDAFAFIPPNLEADVYPNFGPDIGGVKVTITGPDLSDATKVLFGGVDAGEIKLWGEDTIYAYAPPHPIGLVDVTVITPDGPIVYPDAFTYTNDGVPYVYISYPTEENWLILVEDSATQVRISFSNPMNQDPSTGPDWEHSVLNPDNYLLIRAGNNKTFDTTSCVEGVAGDDKKIKINQVASYNPSSNTYNFWLNDGYALNPVEHHLFVCGTTSVEDSAGTTLNAGLMDTMLSFYVTHPLTAQTPDTMPSTGFAPSRVTELPPQTTSYDELGDLWIEIPRLGLKIPIVGVPQLLDGTWDVTWLGDSAGWLEGSAFPSFSGNSVVTGHVFTDKGVPGPFQVLYELLVGDNIYVHVYGERYYYVVQEILRVGPHDVNELINHKDSPWLTLMTCLNWNEATDNYDYHLLIRAQAYGW